MYPSVNIILAGSTELSRVPGISAAGANPEMSMMTPALDVEILMEGRCISMNVPPMTPDGIPTPSLITKACTEITGIEVFPVNAGMKVRPGTQFYETGLGPARDPRIEPSLPHLDIAIKSGKRLSRLMKGMESVMISETIPGGTTTAFAITSMFVKDFRSSSSLPDDPMDTKKKVLDEIIHRTGRNLDPMRALEEAGDYMQAIALSFILDSKNPSIILAGGTQMASVYFLATMMGARMENVELWTTDSVYEHRGKEIEMIVPREKIRHGSIDFSSSVHEGIRKYSLGNVREGAGMGGNILLALQNAGKEEILNRVDSMYGSFIK